MSGSPRIRPDYRSLFPAFTGFSSLPISPYSLCGEVSQAAALDLLSTGCGRFFDC